MSVSRSDYYTFVAGLNTEGGYFTQPPNTWKEGDNVIPNIDGSIGKRKAIDLELNYALSSDSFSGALGFAYTTGVWRNVGGEASRTFYVVQVGRYIYFYGNESLTVSANPFANKIDLNAYRVAGTIYALGTVQVNMTSIDGRLLIVGRDISPIVVEIEDDDSLTVTVLTISIRDFDGLDDGLAIDEQPTILSDEHKYNLLNQGWDTTKINSFYTTNSKYPSNAQMWIYGKNSSDVFDTTVLNKIDFGSSAAPKGRYILNAFAKDRATASGIVGLTTETEPSRPSSVAFFSGRAWFAGAEGSLSSAVFFSRIGNKAADYGECYQVADPTSEVLSDLIESDGGVIYIKEADNIHYILPMFDGIVVFAENGIWQIVGSSQGGFNATGYAVYRVSTVGSISPSAIVQVENQAYYWSTGGIYRVQQDPQSPGIIVSIPVTDLNIKTMYNAIPVINRKYAQGTYNETAKRIVWLYNGGVFNNEVVEAKNKAIVLDLRLTAFYTYTIAATELQPIVVSQFVTNPTSNTYTDYTVVTNAGDLVENAASDIVTVSLLGFSSVAVTEKFLVLTTTDYLTYKITFADFDTDRTAPAKFADWYTWNNAGTYYDAYIITGFDVGTNGPSADKYPIYCSVFMKSTETYIDSVGDAVNESGVRLQTRWDFTNNVVSGKWSAEQEVYRKLRPLFVTTSSEYTDGHPLVITKNKVRGSGKGVQFKFSAHSDKDMQLVGWNVLLKNNGA